MGSTRRSFTAEYKKQAVQLVFGGTPVATVAKNIGVHEMTLRRWVKKESADAAESGRALDINERAELELVRKENAELRMKLEFAKKVATWFAKDQR
jgi:transposase